MRAPGGVIVGLAALVAMAGCGYPDDFTFVEGDSAAPADGAVVRDSALADATSDTSLPLDEDTGVAPDSDAGSGPNVGCSGSTALFCRDFDTASIGDDAFADTYTKGAGSLKIDATQFRSPGKSFQSFLPASTSAENTATGNQSFNAASELTPMRVEVWLRMESIPSGNGPMVFKLGRGSESHGITVYAGDGTFVAEARGPSSTTPHIGNKSFSGNTWLRVRLDAVLTRDATKGWLELYVNDMVTPIAAATGIATTDAASGSTDVKLNIGLYDVARTTSARAWYDDVTFTWL